MKIGRNDQCICGSGKKFKKCCMSNHELVDVKSNVPNYLVCNECGGKAPKSTYQYLDASGITGVDIVISALCQECGAPTIGASGDPEAVQVVMSQLQDEMGGGSFGVT